MDEYGQYLDVMAISCDSFNSETNEKQGRGETGKADDHILNVRDVADLCKRHGIRVKINSVITMYNIHRIFTWLLPDKLTLFFLLPFQK